MVVVGAGDISHAAFADLVARHFETLPSRAVASPPAPARYAGGAVRNPGAFEQVTILLGLQSVGETDPSIHAHKVLARALGGGMSSPLFQEVREKRGLVYSIHAGSDHGTDYGDLIVSAGTSAEHVEELLAVHLRRTGEGDTADRRAGSDPGQEHPCSSASRRPRRNPSRWRRASPGGCSTTGGSSRPRRRCAPWPPSPRRMFAPRRSA